MWGKRNVAQGRFPSTCGSSRSLVPTAQPKGVAQSFGFQTLRLIPGERTARSLKPRLRYQARNSRYKGGGSSAYKSQGGIHESHQ